MTASRLQVFRLLALLLALGPMAALAAPVNREKLAEQYFRASGLESAYLDERQLQLVWLRQLDMIESNLAEKIPGEQRPQLHQFLLSLLPELNAQATDAAQRMRKEMVSVLATTYTDEELKALLAFYSSPVGKRVVAKNEGLASSMGAMVNAYTSVLLKDMQQLVLGKLQAAAQAAQAGVENSKGK